MSLWTEERVSMPVMFPIRGVSARYWKTFPSDVAEESSSSDDGRCLKEATF